MFMLNKYVSYISQVLYHSGEIIALVHNHFLLLYRLLKRLSNRHLYWKKQHPTKCPDFQNMGQNVNYDKFLVVTGIISLCFNRINNIWGEILKP